METRGGKRKGAGRPRVNDLKQTINLYIRKSLIKLHGGKPATIKKLYKAIEIKELAGHL